MPDPFELPGSDPEASPPEPEESGPYPWEEMLAEPEAEGEAAAGPRQRHDAFTAARKCAFLEALVKTGCITEAAARIGVSPRTVYRHQEDDPRFHHQCDMALRMSATPIELTAWSRAVEGVEQEFACGGQVHVRRRYDGSLLRLLLQGSNPKKYGPRPGFKRKQILKHERKQMERELRAEIGSQLRATDDEACRELAKRLKAFGVRTQAQEAEAKLAAGWTRSPEGDWVPPGYGPLAGETAAALGSATVGALGSATPILPLPGAGDPGESV